MATATTLLLLVPTDEIANGMFNVEGFNQVELLGASLVFLVIVGSALRTHSFVPNLKALPPRRHSLSKEFTRRSLKHWRLYHF